MKILKKILCLKRSFPTIQYAIIYTYIHIYHNYILAIASVFSCEENNNSATIIVLFTIHDSIFFVCHYANKLVAGFPHTYTSVWHRYNNKVDQGTS